MMKRVLITGGSRGIGDCIVNRFYDEAPAPMWRINVISKEPPRLKSDGPLEWVEMDLTDIDLLKGWLLGETGYDALVMDAAIVGPQGEQESRGDWEEVVRTNYMANAALIHNTPMMEDGRIVAISSVHGATGVYGASAYASTKAALEGLVRSSALDMAKRHISVNAIRVGFVDAGMFHALSPEHQEKYRSRIPFGHVADPDELAAFVHYLCTAKEAGYITGQVIGYDGGYLSNWWGDG